MKVLFCIGPRCDAEGRASVLLKEARAALAQAFPDEIESGHLKWDTRDCLRLCTRDPVIRLEPSGDAMSNPSVDALLQAVSGGLREPETGPHQHSRGGFGHKKKGPAYAGPVRSEDGR